MPNPRWAGCIKDWCPMLPHAANAVRLRNTYPEQSEGLRSYAARCFWVWIGTRPKTYWLPDPGPEDA